MSWPVPSRERVSLVLAIALILAGESRESGPFRCVAAADRNHWFQGVDERRVKNTAWKFWEPMTARLRSDSSECPKVADSFVFPVLALVPSSHLTRRNIEIIQEPSPQSTEIASGGDWGEAWPLSGIGRGHLSTLHDWAGLGLLVFVLEAASPI